MKKTSSAKSAQEASVPLRWKLWICLGVGTLVTALAGFFLKSLLLGVLFLAELCLLIGWDVVNTCLDKYIKLGRSRFIIARKDHPLLYGIAVFIKLVVALFVLYICIVTIWRPYLSGTLQVENMYGSWSSTEISRTILSGFGALLALLLVGCASVSVPSAAVDKDVKRAQDAARRARADVKEIRAALPRAAAARWELRSRGASPVVSLPIPPAEWSVLKTALSHTEPTPPPAKRGMVCIMYRTWVYLVLLDSKGKEICRKWMKDPFGSPVDSCWVPRSAAESLSPHRSVSLEPEWTLPDADYAALMALPSFAKIYELEKEHLRKR